MRTKILILFLSSSIAAFSQGINNVWLLGYDCCSTDFASMTVDFSQGGFNPVIVSRSINFSETNGSISDSLGNLLFYSNGVYVANANNDTMLNGSGINPGSFVTAHARYGLTIPQANLVIPIPGQTGKYYLFHETSDDPGLTYATYFLYYSIIDMRLDGGLGAVVQKNTVLLHDTLVEGRLTATRHANGRDWWLVAHKDFSGKMYKFLITAAGIQGPWVQDLLTYRDSYFGQAVFSPQGDKFAYYEAFGDLDIWDFDRCTGDFSNQIHVDINDSAAAGGAAFSSTGRFLYLSSIKYMYQFDMQATNIPGSQTTVGVYDHFVSGLPSSFYLSQLAPDGKIYTNCGNGTKVFHVINTPDSLACDFCQHCISLPGYSAFTIPNYPNYFLGALAGSVCDSLTSSIQDGAFTGVVLSLFPNPVKDIAYIRGMNEKIISVELINSIGEIIQQPFHYVNSDEYIELNISLLKGGIYFVRLTGKKGSLGVKMVKVE